MKSITACSRDRPETGTSFAETALAHSLDTTGSCLSFLFTRSRPTRSHRLGRHPFNVPRGFSNHVSRGSDRDLAVLEMARDVGIARSFQPR